MLSFLHDAEKKKAAILFNEQELENLNSLYDEYL